MHWLLRSAFVAGLGLWNVIVNKHLPARHYVAANVAMAAVTTGAARAAGISRADLGMGSRAIRGACWGVGGAALVGAGAGAASRLPATRPLFVDVRADPGAVRYETLVRIPLGTVVLEEVAFRGVLPPVLDGAGRTRASLRTAALFGLWHVLPTANTLDINGIEEPMVRRRAIAAGVAVTAVAGWGLDTLRLRSGSIIAPMLVHWSANAVSYALAARQRQAEAPE